MSFQTSEDEWEALAETTGPTRPLVVLNGSCSSCTWRHLGLHHDGVADSGERASSLFRDLDILYFWAME